MVYASTANIPQRDFIYTCPSRVFDDASLTLNELKIYMMIRSFMDTTGNAYPSNAWIAERLGINKRNTIHNINKLVKKGYLERITLDGKRYLRIPVAIIPDDDGCRKRHGGGVVDDTGGGVFEDTQLLQSNITSKFINPPIVPPEGDGGGKVAITKSSKPSHYKDDALFMEFWAVYPNKQKPAVAYKAFLKLKPTKEMVAMLIKDLQQRMQYNWRNRDISKIPHPSTYLNAREWEGDILRPTTAYDLNDHGWSKPTGMLY